MISQALESKKSELSKCSETSKLWVNNLQMLGVARELVEADRIGSWQMHLHAKSDRLPIFSAAGHPNYLESACLYLQKIVTLESDNPAVFQKFVNGFRVIRRSDQYWADLGSDLVIEQTLMRTLKSTGGLTRGSGMWSLKSTGGLTRGSGMWSLKSTGGLTRGSGMWSLKSTGGLTRGSGMWSLKSTGG